VVQGTGWRTIRCHAPAFLLRHPVHGALLFDTGYAPRILDAFQRWPARAYALATPTTLGAPVVQQLPAHGVSASDVHTIIVSHLHADHVAGLRDFPHTALVLDRAALALAGACTGVDAVRRGIIPALLPTDLVARAQPVDAWHGDALPGLGATHDLFGDGSVRLVRLPGHARGQIGALVTSHRGRVLLCADGAWSSLAYRTGRMPHPMAWLLQDDLRALRATLQALRVFAEAAPDVTVLPTHCAETLAWGAAA
jgi:glyoxylase-like metal-dependent hydrolase (beta-lactamase superfamily II)